MKRIFATMLSGLLLAGMARAQSAYYINNSVVMAPPQPVPVVDATNFVNNNFFEVFTPNLYDFSDVLNFTNRGTMAGGAGFLFETEPSSSGVAHPAANFDNENNVNMNLDNALISGDQIIVLATNLINRGTLSIDSGGQINLTGNDVDVSRSTFIVGGLTDRTTDNAQGIIDNFTGFGTNTWIASVNLSTNNPTTGPFQWQSQTTFKNQNADLSFTTNALASEMVMPNAMPTATRSDQIVFVNNPDTNINVRVLFSGNTPQNLGTVIVEWSAPITNIFGQLTTNFLFLTDTYGADQTNGVFTNFDGVTAGTGGVTLQPMSFSLTRTPPPQLLTALSGTNYAGPDTDEKYWSTNQLAPIFITNDYAAYQAQLLTTSFPGAVVPGQTLQDIVRDLPGRVEITGTGVLDLNQVRIQGLNYLMISGTNHFTGSSNAVASSTYSDIYLGSTNGILSVSNIIQPLIQQFSGTISIYSGVWSNQYLYAGTNIGESVNEALFVDASGLTNENPATCMDLSLNSRNSTNGLGQVILGQSFDNLVGNFTMNAADFTLMSNVVLSLNPAGPSDTQYWDDGVPYLDSFTNYGDISGPNTMYFEGQNTGLPYINFVNDGIIDDYGTVIAADYLENDGGIFSGTGQTTITAGTAVFPSVPGLPASINSDTADITITCTNLYITNQFLNPGRALWLGISGALNAGTNTWVVHDGFNLVTKPLTGDFNLLTVTNIATAYENVYSEWAGTDLGPAASGFTNNAAVGRVILDGGPNSAFTFYGANGTSNALYVDVIEFKNNITNLDASGNLENVSVQPGMTIYYAHAYSWIGGIPQPFTTNIMGKNGGAFVQVNHSGVIHTSSAPPEGLGPGGVSTSDLGLNVTVSAAPLPVALISWNTVAGATNDVYYESSLNGQWQLLTNFVSTVTGPVSVTDALDNGGRFYRVSIAEP